MLIALDALALNDEIVEQMAASVRGLRQRELCAFQRKLIGALRCDVQSVASRDAVGNRHLVMGITETDCLRGAGIRRLRHAAVDSRPYRAPLWTSVAEQAPTKARRGC